LVFSRPLAERMEQPPLAGSAAEPGPAAVAEFVAGPALRRDLPAAGGALPRGVACAPRHTHPLACLPASAAAPGQPAVWIAPSDRRAGIHWHRPRLGTLEPVDLRLSIRLSLPARPLSPVRRAPHPGGPHARGQPLGGLVASQGPPARPSPVVRLR